MATSRTGIDACHHVAVVVRDFTAARAFYADVLGLEELPRPAEVAGMFKGAWFRLGVSELHVFEQPDFEPYAGKVGPHLALHTSDFDATVERLRGRGCAFAFGPGRGPDGISRVIVRDPTGNTIEITDAALRA